MCIYLKENTPPPHLREYRKYKDGWERKRRWCKKKIMMNIRGGDMEKSLSRDWKLLVRGKRSSEVEGN
jgi:hypothetical protein